MTEDFRPSGGYRVAWSSLFILSIVLVGIGLVFLFTPQIDGFDLDFLGFDGDTLMLGLATLAIGLFSSFLVWYGIRDGSELSVRITWTVPVLTVGVAAILVLDEEALAAAVYCGMAALAAWLLALLGRKLG